MITKIRIIRQFANKGTWSIVFDHEHGVTQVLAEDNISGFTRDYAWILKEEELEEVVQAARSVMDDSSKYVRTSYLADAVSIWLVEYQEDDQWYSYTEPIPCAERFEPLRKIFIKNMEIENSYLDRVGEEI